MSDIMETYHKSGHKRYKALSEELAIKLEDEQNRFEHHRETTEYIENMLGRENARLAYYNLLIEDIVKAGESHTLPQVFEDMEADKDDSNMPWEKVLENFNVARER